MSLPTSESFANLQGSLGTGSVTIDGLTFFSDDPSAVMSVGSDHHLSFGTSTGSHVVGYKTADGSNFDPTGGNGLGSFSVYTVGSYTVQLYRDGVLVAGSAFTTPGPSYFDITVLSKNIDEVRFIYSDNNLILDDLNISSPVRDTNAPPVIANLGGDEVTYVEEGSAISLDDGSNATVTDDSFNVFTGGTLAVTVLANLSPTEDVIGLDQSGSVSLSNGYAEGSIVSVSGAQIGKIAAGSSGKNGEPLTIIFSSSADMTNIQTLVRALTYENSNAVSPSTLHRTLHLEITDGDGGSSFVNVGVSVVGVPDLPTAGHDTLYVSNGTTANLSLAALLANDSSPFDLPLSITGIGPAGEGVAALHAAGSFSYTAPHLGTDDSFTYVLSNGDGTSTGQVDTKLLAATVGDDKITVPSLAGEFSYVDGGEGADKITGGAGTDILLGSAGADRLLGNLGADSLIGGSGDDNLNGGLGDDVMKGGGGDDVYAVDSSGDVVNEAAGGGNDQVKASASYQLAAAARVEMLTTADKLGTDALDLTGNALSQEIVGNDGTNTISDGGAGAADTMQGQGGGDTYWVFNIGDVIVEATGKGNDTVLASVNYALGTGVHVEALATSNAADSSALQLFGNDFGQTITGNAGNNVIKGFGGKDALFGGDGVDKLFGGSGNDKIDGGAGADKFIFDTGLSSSDNVDTISNFETIDELRLSSSVFTQAGANGTLAASAFAVNDSGNAADGSDRIIYEQDTGALYYDPNGSAAGGRVLFAIIDKNLALSNTDFVVF